MTLVPRGDLTCQGVYLIEKCAMPSSPVFSVTGEAFPLFRLFGEAFAQVTLGRATLRLSNLTAEASTAIFPHVSHPSAIMCITAHPLGCRSKEWSLRAMRAGVEVRRLAPSAGALPRGTCAVRYAQRAPSVLFHRCRAWRNCKR